MNDLKKERLESLDILRGLDLFILVAFQPVFMQLAKASGDGSWLKAVFNALFTHVEWEGFHLWDQVMPLFMFMAGTSISYAMAGYKEGKKAISGRLFYRVSKRVILLWIFGAIVQGNLLDLDFSTLHLYTDTLQAIAMGYLFSVILYLLLPTKGLIAVFFLLPVIYTTGMLLTGGYAPGNNLAELIDHHVLGRFWGGAYVADSGEVIFAEWYHISWVYSTLNFTATMLSGVLTGCVLRTCMANRRKVLLLLSAMTVCFVSAFIFSRFEPVIKRLWTSSMTFLSSGFSILLMTLSYVWIDLKKRGKYLKWLKIYGMNSILAYMLFYTLNTESLRNLWLHGFEHLTGNYYPVLFTLSHVAIVFLILYYLYRKRIFLKA